jgi:hypothetical protein
MLYNKYAVDTHCRRFDHLRTDRTTGLDGPSFESRYGQDFIHFSKTSRPPLAPTHPPIQWAPRFFTLGVVKRPKRSVRSSPSSAVVKNERSYYDGIRPAVVR